MIGGGLVRHVGGVRERGAGRRLHDAEEVALVFLRNEGRGHMLVHVDGGGKSGDEERDHDGLEAHDEEGDQRGIPASETLDAVVDPLEQAAVVLLRPQEDGGERG